MNSHSDHGKLRAVMRWTLAAFYAAAGIAHLAAPEQLLAITPDWVPFGQQVIFTTGLCELAGAAALVTEPLRWWAGIAFAAYAVCVWPANFKHGSRGWRQRRFPVAEKCFQERQHVIHRGTQRACPGKCGKVPVGDGRKHRIMAGSHALLHGG